MSFRPFHSLLAQLGLGANNSSPSPSSSTSSEKSSSSGASAADDPDIYEPSAMDVVVAKEMLQQGLDLPTEVVLSILDFAEYWPHTTVETDSSFTVHSGRAQENRFVLRTKPLGLIKNTHPSERYFAFTPAPPLPLAADAEYPLEQFQQWIGGPTDIVKRPCRKIVFTITSHDQGWSHNAMRDRGTYRGSCTWFEAGLERFDRTATRPKANNDAAAGGGAAGGDAQPDAPSSSKSNEKGKASADATTAPQGRVPARSPSRRPLSEDDGDGDGDGDDEDDDEDEEAPSPTVPYLPIYALRPIYPTLEEGQAPPALHHDLLASPKHTIQFNKTATGIHTTHTVVWSWTDDVAPPTAEELRELGRGEETGRGDFVRDLKPGDVVTVWAKSRFGGWANHVQSVRVDLYWAP